MTATFHGAIPPAAARKPCRCRVASQLSSAVIGARSVPTVGDGDGVVKGWRARLLLRLQRSQNPGEHPTRSRDKGHGSRLLGVASSIISGWGPSNKQGMALIADAGITWPAHPRPRRWASCSLSAARRCCRARLKNSGRGLPSVVSARSRAVPCMGEMTTTPTDWNWETLLSSPGQ